MGMKPANLLSQKPSRWIAIIAIFAILAPTAAPAQSRHAAPEAVRARVLKLGVGQWIRVREQSGVKLDGQITGIGPRVFQMQRRDAAAPTDVYYADVEKIRCAPSERLGDGLSKDEWAGLAVTTAIVVAIFASCGVHHNC
jgi:hypothetical protein